MEITADIMDKYRNTGGFDIIGSGRTKLEEVDQFEKGIQILRELNIKALVIHASITKQSNLAISFTRSRSPKFSLIILFIFSSLYS